MRTRGWLAVLALAAAVATASAGNKKKQAAEKPPEPPPPPVEAAEDTAGSDEGTPMPDLPHVEGPKLVDLGHGAEIALPANLVLYEATAAQQIMRDWGNSPDGVLAVILRHESPWAIVIDADDVGYVSDSDADNLDAGELLSSFREGSTHQNIERKARGIPELFIDGWSQLPSYDRVHHHMVWGLDAHDVTGKVINFDTRLLGRNGYLAFGLIDTPDHIAAARTETQPILDAIHFKPGSRYEDHTSGDKDSGIGLRGLVLGGVGVAVAKKTGLLVAFIAFFKKGFILIGAALAGAFRWLFRRKKAAAVELRDEPPAPPADPPPA